MKYPWAPLAEAMRVSENAAVMALGVNGRMGQTYRHEGMSERVAERLAVKAGFHPAEVWPGWMDDSIEAAKVACVECGAMFLPTRAGHSCCTERCRSRRTRRLRYATDPEYREHRRVRAAAYYAENGEYVRWRERRSYRAERANG